MKVYNLINKNFLSCEKDCLASVLINYKLNCQVKHVIVCDKGNIIAVYSMADLLFLYYNEEYIKDDEKLSLINNKFAVIVEDLGIDSILKHDDDILVVTDKDGEIIGIIEDIQNKKENLLLNLSHNNKFVDSYYRKMVENLGEEIFVTDGQGKVIFINPASEKTFEMSATQIIGKNVTDLQEEGILSASSTLQVMKTGQKVDIIQKVNKGKSLLATGIPIFKKNGEIDMIISTSKDVDQLNRLLDKTERQDKKLDIQTEEIKTLREEIFLNEGFVSRSKSMDIIKNTITKIASLDMNVLIGGETGVGKEVLVKSIHRYSNRADKPFIKINCGMIPENLMESEFFGYKGGAFTGANRGGKIGKVELADGGTLFLDEIGEMPLMLQVKLLDFLQDKTITPVGGSEKIKVDARIIAATNRDLKLMCQNGDFRWDLYYRLNVVPIDIPSLRERREDIEAITKFYLNQYNNKYRGEKRLSEDIIERFLEYNWPGNIRELQHVLERIYITTEGNFLTAQDFERLINENDLNKVTAKVYCTDIIPLKEAKWEVERQLVYKAYDIYGSTYKAAKALNVDQSTIVKLMRKHSFEKY